MTHTQVTLHCLQLASRVITGTKKQKHIRCLILSHWDLQTASSSFFPGHSLQKGDWVSSIRAPILSNSAPPGLRHNKCFAASGFSLLKLNLGLLCCLIQLFSSGESSNQTQVQTKTTGPRAPQKLVNSGVVHLTRTCAKKRIKSSELLNWCIKLSAYFHFCGTNTELNGIMQNSALLLSLWYLDCIK